MARKKSTELTSGEQSIMTLLWQHGELSVKDITAQLNQEKDTAYTTVQTMCKILVEKGYAEYRKESRAYIYRPKISEKDARKGALSSLLDRFFGSSPELLAQHLLQETDIELKDLEAIQRKIDKAD